MSIPTSPLSHEVATGGSDPYAAIRHWLIVLWVMVLVMVAIGGITRLTGSGLSIVHWKPVSGALPPLDEQAWQESFDAYRASPQFREINRWMTLPDFKRIFFWEYLHRLLGRLIGLAAFVPWLYFVWRKRMSPRMAWKTASVIVIGGLQGALGWYMVKSGLVDMPRVSHLRLAAHLLLGMGVGQWILWLALSLRAEPQPAVSLTPTARWLARGLLPLLALQVVYGAFMAGTHAGLLFSTFPDMNGRYLPSSFVSSSPLAGQLLYNPMLIHYVHRALALLVFLHIAAWLWLVRGERALRPRSYALGAALALQLVLGVLTVMLHVPIVLGVLHQLGAYLLVSCAVACCHAALGSTEASDAREVGDRHGGLAGTGQDLRRA